MDTCSCYCFYLYFLLCCLFFHCIYERNMYRNNTRGCSLLWKVEFLTVALSAPPTPLFMGMLALNYTKIYNIYCISGYWKAASLKGVTLSCKEAQAVWIKMKNLIWWIIQPKRTNETNWGEESTGRKVAEVKNVNWRDKQGWGSTRKGRKQSGRQTDKAVWGKPVFAWQGGKEEEGGKESRSHHDPNGWK